MRYRLFIHPFMPFLRAIFTLFLVLTSAGAHAIELDEVWQLSKRNQYDEALTQINQYLVENPRDADGKMLKAMILGALEQDDLAISTLSDLTLERPDLAQPYNNLAVLYARQGEYEKAKTALEKLMSIAPEYPLARENLAEVYTQLALEIYKAQLERADNYAKMAIQQYETVLTKDGQNDEVKTKLKTIRQIYAFAANKPWLAPEKIAATPTKPVALDTAKEQAAIMSMAKQWLEAWQTQHVPEYLGFYSPTFKTPNDIPRNLWEKQREERILMYPSINISMTDAKITFLGEVARLSFKQTFQAGDKPTMTDTKVLMLKKNDSQWMIEQEKTIAVLPPNVAPIVNPLPPQAIRN